MEHKSDIITQIWYYAWQLYLSGSTFWMQAFRVPGTNEIEAGQTLKNIYFEWK